jgi:hypothetical protein
MHETPDALMLSTRRIGKTAASEFDHLWQGHTVEADLRPTAVDQKGIAMKSLREFLRREEDGATGRRLTRHVARQRDEAAIGVQLSGLAAVTAYCPSRVASSTRRAHDSVKPSSDIQRSMY